MNQVGPLEVLLQYDGNINVEGMGAPMSARMSVMHNTPLMEAAFAGANDALRFLLGKTSSSSSPNPQLFLT